MISNLVRHSRYPDPVLPAASLPEYILEHASRYGQRVALIDGVSGETVTYVALADAICSTADRLQSEGVGPGTPVALAAVNQPAWVIAFYAVLCAGGTVVPLNPVFTAGEVGELLARCGADLVIADDQARDAVAAAAGQVLDLAELVTADGKPVRRRRPTEPSRTAVIAFSSGTTGLPKGVQLSHRNLVATVVQHEGIYHVGTDDVVVAALPLFHVYGMSIVLGYALRHGATVVTLPRFDLPRYLALIAEHRVTWLHVAPPLALALLSETAARADLSSVRHVVSGAAPLDAKVAARLAERVGCSIGQGYGLTEAAPGLTWVPDDDGVPCPPGSVGVLVAGTEARLVDPASGVDTASSGEL